MDKNEIKELLKNYKSGNISEDETISKFKDIGIATIDNHREIRVGYPEIIYCEGKTPGQVKEIISYMMKKNHNILGTRASEEVYLAVKKICPRVEYI